MGESFDFLKKWADDLKASCGTRDKDYRKYEDMYLLKDSSLPDESWVRETISPDPRNALQGAVRLLTATEPKWNVPSNIYQVERMKELEELEQYAKAIYDASNRAKKKAIHIDLALMALLYAEAPVAIRLTSDMLAMASESHRLRLEATAKRAPVLFDVMNPKFGYPEFDSLGMSAYYITYERPISEVISVFGKDAEKVLKGKKSTDKVTFNEMWTLGSHCVWIGNDQLMLVPNEYPFVPVANAIVEGSALFSEEGKASRQPFLYTLEKTGVWSSTNLALTTMYSLIGALGRTAQNVFTSPFKTPPEFDWDYPFGLALMKPGEKIEPYKPNIVDPQILEAVKIAEAKMTESTIYRQALGEPVGANAPFSMVALLSQAGRLPLVPYQKMCSSILTDAMQMALQIIKKKGADQKAYSEGGIVTIDPKKIPEVIDITCELEIAEPTDEQQNAVAAAQLTGGDNPLLSADTARSKYLKVNQPLQEQYKIWAEQFANAQHKLALQAQAMQLQNAGNVQNMQSEAAIRGQLSAQQQQAEMQQAMMQQQMSQVGAPPQSGEMAAAMAPNAPGQTGAQSMLPGSPVVNPNQIGRGEPTEPAQVPGGF